MSDVIFNTENPDSASIVNKSTIDIGIYETDISASAYSRSIKLNYTNDSIIVEIPEDSETFTGGYTYYTPMYTEKLSYEVWKTVADKTFKELN